jgi:hypothetical protein
MASAFVRKSYPKPAVEESGAYAEEDSSFGGRDLGGECGPVGSEASAEEM